MQLAANFVPCDLAEGRKSGWLEAGWWVGGGLSFLCCWKTQTFCCCIVIFFLSLITYICMCIYIYTFQCFAIIYCKHWISFSPHPGFQDSEWRFSSGIQTNKPLALILMVAMGWTHSQVRCKGGCCWAARRVEPCSRELEAWSKHPIGTHPQIIGLYWKSLS